MPEPQIISAGDLLTIYRQRIDMAGRGEFRPSPIMLRQARALVEELERGDLGRQIIGEQTPGAFVFIDLESKRKIGELTTEDSSSGT